MLDPSLVDDKYMLAIRGHPITVVSQLSEEGIKQAGSIGMTSVRLLLAALSGHDDSGFEGSSNLFYYLFDYWLDTYRLIIRVQTELEVLVGNYYLFEFLADSILGQRNSIRTCRCPYPLTGNFIIY